MSSPRKYRVEQCPLAFLAHSKQSWKTLGVLEWRGEEKVEVRHAHVLANTQWWLPCERTEGCQLEFKPRSITQSPHSGGLTLRILHPWGQLICPEGTGPRRAWLLAAKWLGGKF